MNTTVYVLIDNLEGRTFAEVSGDGLTAVTLAFVDRKAAHDYRNRHGLPQHLTPQPFTVDHLDRAAAKSLEWFNEPATWRLVTDRSIAPNISADRIDPITGEIEIVHWSQYWTIDYIWRQAQAELLADKPAILA